MPKARKITVRGVTSPAPKAAVPAKPGKAVAAKPVNTSPLGTAAAKQAARSNVVPTAVATPSKRGNASTGDVAKPTGGNIARTARTVAAQATNFGGVISDRDTAYIAFYAGFAKRNNGAAVSLADVYASGKRPAYDGSNKPHDAGVIVRLTKAGIIAPMPDGTAFRFTKRGTELAAYGKAGKAA